MTRLLWTYRLRHRPCNRQLTQLEGNLSNIIDAAIGSLQVLVWIGYNWLRLTWSLTRPQADWPPKSPPNCLCYCQPRLGGQFMTHLNLQFVDFKSVWFLISRCRDASLANWALESTRNHLSYRWPQFNRHIKGLRWSDECAPKSVRCIAHIVTCQKGVIHDIPCAEHIWNCNSDNRVKAYPRIWPRRKEYR